MTAGKLHVVPMDEDSDANDALADVDWVSRRLGVRKAWIYQHVHSRTLPFKYGKVGPFLRFRKRDVEHYIESIFTK